MSGLSDAKICNWALAHCGIQQQITALNDASPMARMCALFYADTRDGLLREWPWPFATAYATLSQLASTPNLEWGYSYSLPSDCVRARYLIPNSGVAPSVLGGPINVPGAWMQGWQYPLPVDQWQIPYALGTSPAGPILLTDEQVANLVYTAQVTNAAFFDVLFGEALAYMLATKLCMPLTISEARSEKIATAAGAAVMKAKNASQNEVNSRPNPPSVFEQARY